MKDEGRRLKAGLYWRNGLTGAELAAGGVGFEAARIAHTVFNVVLFEDVAKLGDPFGGGALVVRIADRVVGDQVDMGLKAFEVVGEFLGLGGAVVHAREEDVFKGDAAFSGFHIGATVGEEGFEGVGAGTGNQLFAQALVGGVEADSEGDLELMFGQLRDPTGQADGGDGERSHPNPHILIEAMERLHYLIEV